MFFSIIRPNRLAQGGNGEGVGRSVPKRDLGITLRRKNHFIPILNIRTLMVHTMTGRLVTATRTESILMEVLNQRMASGSCLATAPTDEAQDWLEYSLTQGFDLSAAVLASDFFSTGSALAVVSNEFSRTEFDYATGGVLDLRLAKLCLARVLCGLAADGAETVLVEDDLMRRWDPVLAQSGLASGFMGQRIIHWGDLRVPCSKAVDTVSRGASGYPLNGFLVTRPAVELGLIDAQDVPEHLAQDVVSALIAVVVAAFDAESFLLWLRDSSLAASLQQEL